jgi:hypothetical protein
MPLEPIEESDLDLKDKIVEKKIESLSFQKERALEDAPSLEIAAERKEGAAEKDSAYSKIVSKIKVQSPQTTHDEVVEDADQAGQLMDAQSRISNLVDIAMQKGVVHAVRVAKHLDDNYILDEFHDKLMADDLHDALVEKGLIKDV